MIKRIKNKIGNQEDDFEFIVNISRGLVAVFANNKDNISAQHNLAITTYKALDLSGINAPSHIKTTPKGTIILAESYKPARPIMRQNP